jgi:hypothetical protein
MIYPFKWGHFWYSYVLERLGRIGWGRKLGINEYAEGAIVLAILEEIWNDYPQIIVGGGSYVLNNLSTIAFGLFVNSWLFYSAHVLFSKLGELGKISEIMTENKRAFADGTRVPLDGSTNVQ